MESRHKINQGCRFDAHSVVCVQIECPNRKTSSTLKRTKMRSSLSCESSLSFQQEYYNLACAFPAAWLIGAGAIFSVSVSIRFPRSLLILVNISYVLFLTGSFAALK